MPQAAARRRSTPTEIARDVVAAARLAPTPATAAPGQATQLEDILGPVDRLIVDEARVQVRLPLLDPAQVQRDLLLLRAAIDRALTHVKDPAQRDRSILLAVRGVIHSTNAAINARWRGGK